MIQTATLPLPLELTEPELTTLPCSLEEVYFREYTSTHTKYNPDTQIREDRNGIPLQPRMDEAGTLYPDTWDIYDDGTFS